jgi:hypothetical protein
MQNTDFDNFIKNIVNFIHFGKLPNGVTVNNFIQNLSLLNPSQLSSLKRELKSVRHTILNPDPVSFHLDLIPVQRMAQKH